MLVRCFPNSFTIGLELSDKSIRLCVGEDLKISIDSDGVDEKEKTALCEVVQRSSSLVLCVHKWCKSL